MMVRGMFRPLVTEMMNTILDDVITVTLVSELEENAITLGRDDFRDKMVDLMCEMLDAKMGAAIERTAGQ